MAFSLPNLPERLRLSERVFQLLAALWTILAALATIFKPQDFVTKFLCLQSAFLFILLAVEEFRWHRKARYAEAQHLIHLAYHHLRDATWNVLYVKNDTIILASLQQSLHSFAAAWSLITGAACRVCVTDIYCDDLNATPTDDGLLVKPLCRHEPTPERDGSPDKLKDNSDFFTLWKKPSERWFCSNDLLEDLKKGYRNSHWPADAVARGELNYIAACVWPIRKVLLKGVQPHDLVGYLCIDSKTRHVFQKRFDFELGAAFADALYSFMKIQRETKAGNLFPS